MQRRLASFCFAALAMAAPAVSLMPRRVSEQARKFIVPFPAGGINDVLARIAADKLQANWGQPIIIEQKTGAGGNIGADLAAQAEPDGYTLLVAPPGPLAINGSLYKQLSYKPEISCRSRCSATCRTCPSCARIFRRIRSRTDRLRESNPGKVVFGSQGNGATPHLTANLFMTLTGTKMVHVPYRGETLVLQDMLGGHVDLFFGNVSAALALWRDGKIKVLAVTDKSAPPPCPTYRPPRRPAARPHRVGWFAVVGPPKLPPRCATRSPTLHRNAKDSRRRSEVAHAERGARRPARQRRPRPSSRTRRASGAR